jgi:hypothetical protein
MNEEEIYSVISKTLTPLNSTILEATKKIDEV